MWTRLLCAAMFAHASSGAYAAAGTTDTYPDKPIRIIVGFTPGGSDDTIARVVGTKLTERFGQPVIVDNRPGTGGNLGAELLARATPDGYTISSVGSITVASGPSLYRNIGYDPLKDFAYVSVVAVGANVVVAGEAEVGAALVEAMSADELTDSAARTDRRDAVRAHLYGAAGFGPHADRG